MCRYSSRDSSIQISLSSDPQTSHHVPVFATDIKNRTSSIMHYTTTILALLTSLAAVNATKYIHFGCCNRKAAWAWKPYATGRCCQGRGEPNTTNGVPTCLIQADTRPLVDFGFCCIAEGKDLGIKDWRECGILEIERP